MVIGFVKNGINAVKVVDGATKVLVQGSGKLQNIANGGVFNSMIEGLGKVLGFSGKVLSESSSSAQTLIKANSLLTDKFAALTAIGLGVGVTAGASSDILKHLRTDYLIESRSGAYMTDKDTNENLRNVSIATAGVGVVAGLQGASTLAGESLLRANSSSAGASLMKTVGNSASKILGAVTGATGSLGDAIKPGLGKMTGSPLALMLGGFALHWAINEIYLKMPQGDSFFNSFGWGGKKNFVVTDRTDANFLQPLGREALMKRIDEDVINGMGRAATSSTYWDAVV